MQKKDAPDEKLIESQNQSDNQEEQLPEPNIHPTKYSVQEQLHPNLADSVSIRLQRTACFGRCPIYVLTIYDGGYVEYLGEKWTDVEGKAYCQIDQKSITEIQNKAAEIGFFELNNNYDNEYITDLPSTITTLRNNDEFKTVVNRYEGPKKLKELEDYIDAVFQNIDWKKIESED